MADGLTRGQAWAARVREEYVLNASQEITADIAADTIDLIDSLPPDRAGEARAQRTILLRALSQLALPDEDGGDIVPLSASQRGKRAANIRWHGGDR